MASEEGKLEQIALRSMKTKDFPLGLYSDQATMLSDWAGSIEHPAFKDLINRLERKLRPQWLDETIASLTNRINTEENHSKDVRAQLKAAETQLAVAAEEQKRFDDRLSLKDEEINGLSGELNGARQQLENRDQELADARERVRTQTNDLEQNLAPKPLPRTGWLWGAFLTISAAIVSAGFTYSSMVPRSVHNLALEQQAQEHRKEQARLETQITGLTSEATGLRSAIETKDIAISVAQGRATAFQTQLEELDKQLETATKDLENANAKISQLQTSFHPDRLEFNRLVKNAYDDASLVFWGDFSSVFDVGDALSVSEKLLF